MEWIHWIWLAATLAVIAAGWFFVLPMLRGWRTSDRRTAEQSTRSAVLAKECGTAFGRLSTIR